jgi:hypothetical protein
MWRVKIGFVELKEERSCFVGSGVLIQQFNNKLNKSSSVSL